MRIFRRIEYNSPVILTFALVSGAVLLLNSWTNGWTNPHLFCVYRSSLLDPLFYVRIFGHVLGHADWAHYFNNMMFILLLGPLLEEKYGGRTIIYAILLTAVITAVAHLLLSPSTALLGASGIVFMLILLASFTSFSQGNVPLTFILIAAIYIGNEIISGFTISDNISRMSHIIGGFCGALFGVSVRPARGRRR